MDIIERIEYVNCPRCAHKNRLVKQDRIVRYFCGNCSKQLPLPFTAENLSIHQIKDNSFCAVIDTETNGLFKKENKPRMVQLAWSIFRIGSNINIVKRSFIVKALDFDPNPGGKLKHNIDKARSLREGVDSAKILQQFKSDVYAHGVSLLVGHNIEFDAKVLEIESLRWNVDFSDILYLSRFCTMKESVRLLGHEKYQSKVDEHKRTHGPRKKSEEKEYSDYRRQLYRDAQKYPTLLELHQYFFGDVHFDWHNAVADVEACERCFKAMLNKSSELNEKHRESTRRAIEEDKVRRAEKERIKNLNNQGCLLPILFFFASITSFLFFVFC